MQGPSRRRPPRLLVLAAGTVVGLGLAELAVRAALPSPRVLGALYFRDAAGTERGAAEARALGLVAPVETPPGVPSPPRPRTTFAPGARFFLCYRDHDALRREWLDPRGCVEVAFSRWGIREREEIGPDKPPGQRRIVCVGDSFTMGWGVRAEDTWVRLLEQILRQEGADVRTVNCGAAGAIVADEYAWALRHRFHVFQPDLVVVTLCLNDLLPTSGGLCQLRPPRGATGSALVDRLLDAIGPGPLDLDPSVDWVDLLMAEPEGSPLYSDEVPYDAMWARGTPQRALREMRDFCRERGIGFAATLWPFLQGLDEGQFYPFARVHDLVGALCTAEGIPFLDLLPVLRGHRPEDLWVTPSDMHGNPTAQRLAASAIAPFLRRLLPR